MGAAAAEGARRARASTLVEHGLVSERLGRSPLGHYVFGAQAPDAGNMEILHKYGTRRAEGALARAARARRDPLVLLDDRAGEPGLEPDDAVVHARVRDGDHYVIDGHKWFTTAADGAAFAIVMAVTEPRGAAARARVDDHRADRHAGLRAACATSRSWATPATAGRSHAEIWYRDVRVPVDEPARPRGRRLPDRAGAARPRPHPPLHALDRHLRARVRHDVPRASRRRKIDDEKTLATRQIVAGLGRRGARRDRRRAPDGAARGVDDRAARASRPRATRSR